mmetsp:Transcript_76691/g.248241  ORF Transcript_76691/g.248241 Transcript_76691/m.248241 type:complete len:1227 (-) Transcript_76691:217-3897(-)
MHRSINFCKCFVYEDQDQLYQGLPLPAVDDTGHDDSETRTGLARAQLVNAKQRGISVSGTAQSRSQSHHPPRSQSLRPALEEPSIHVSRGKVAASQARADRAGSGPQEVRQREHSRPCQAMPGTTGAWPLLKDQVRQILERVKPADGILIDKFLQAFRARHTSQFEPHSYGKRKVIQVLEALCDIVSIYRDETQTWLFPWLGKARKPPPPQGIGWVSEPHELLIAKSVHIQDRDRETIIQRGCCARCFRDAAQVSQMWDEIQQMQRSPRVFVFASADEADDLQSMAPSWAATSFVIISPQKFDCYEAIGRSSLQYVVSLRDALALLLANGHRVQQNLVDDSAKECHEEKSHLGSSPKQESSDVESFRISNLDTREERSHPSCWPSAPMKQDQQTPHMGSDQSTQDTPATAVDPIQDEAKGSDGKPGTVKHYISAQIEAALQNDYTFRFEDFRGPVKQHLHAIHTHGGSKTVEKAFALVKSATLRKQRKEVRNWPHFITVVLREYLQSMKGFGSQVTAMPVDHKFVDEDARSDDSGQTDANNTATPDVISTHADEDPLTVDDPWSKAIQRRSASEKRSGRSCTTSLISAPEMPELLTEPVGGIEESVLVDDVLYTQKSCGGQFRNGMLLSELVSKLNNKEIDLFTAPFLKLEVIKKCNPNGGFAFYSNNNRRLYCLKEHQKTQQHQVRIRVKVTLWTDACDRFLERFDTESGGHDITIRGRASLGPMQHRDRACSVQAIRRLSWEAPNKTRQRTRSSAIDAHELEHVPSSNRVARSKSRPHEKYSAKHSTTVTKSSSSFASGGEAQEKLQRQIYYDQASKLHKLEFPVELDDVGSIIGREGSHIQHCRSRTGATIFVSKEVGKAFVQISGPTWKSVQDADFFAAEKIVASRSQRWTNAGEDARHERPTFKDASTPPSRRDVELFSTPPSISTSKSTTVASSVPSPLNSAVSGTLSQCPSESSGAWEKYVPKSGSRCDIVLLRFEGVCGELHMSCSVIVQLLVSSGEQQELFAGFLWIQQPGTLRIALCAGLLLGLEALKGHPEFLQAGQQLVIAGRSQDVLDEICHGPNRLDHRDQSTCALMQKCNEMVRGFVKSHLKQPRMKLLHGEQLRQVQDLAEIAGSRKMCSLQAPHVVQLAREAGARWVVARDTDITWDDCHDEHQRQAWMPQETSGRASTAWSTRVARGCGHEHNTEQVGRHTTHEPSSSSLAPTCSLIPDLRELPKTGS